MKFATIMLIGICLLGSLAPLSAGDETGAAQAAIGFSGGSQWNPWKDATHGSGTCVWYLPVVGDLAVSRDAKTASPALFSDPANPSLQTAYLIWVSDFEAIVLPPAANQGFTMVLAPAGTARIYFTTRPDTRDWSDPKNPDTRRTWGEVVATFTRNVGHLYTPDGFGSDTFIFTADLVSSKTFVLNGRPFNFRSLIPRGMTCFEQGRAGSTAEAGTCIAAGR